MKEKFDNLETNKNVEAFFDNEKMTFLLKMNPGGVDLLTTQSFANEKDLNAKDEFHLTVIGTKGSEVIQEVLNAMSDEEKAAKLEEIQSMADSIDWTYELAPEFYYIKKDYEREDAGESYIEKRQAIIQKAEINGLEDFYNSLNNILETDIPVPMPHLTLYTTSTREDKKLRGIGVNSKDDFEKLEPEKI